MTGGDPGVYEPSLRKESVGGPLTEFKGASAEAEKMFSEAREVIAEAKEFLQRANRLTERMETAIDKLLSKG